MAQLRADGSKLRAWFLPAQGQGKRRAGVAPARQRRDMSAILSLVASLPPRGFDVLTLDYRGLGRSQGTPWLDGSRRRCGGRARPPARARSDVDATRLIIVGQSLGGATALRLLARDAKGASLAVIVSAFASYRHDRARSGVDVSHPRTAGAARHEGLSRPRKRSSGGAALGACADDLRARHARHGHRARSQRAVARCGERAEGAWTVDDGEHVAVFGNPGPWRERLAAALDTAVR